MLTLASQGFAPLNVAVRRGQRSNSYVEYIKPYERLRKSLTVIRYANVLEVCNFSSFFVAKTIAMKFHHYRFY